MAKNGKRNKNGLVSCMMRKGLAFSVVAVMLVAVMASVGVVEAGADEGKIAFVSAGNIHLINPDGTNEVRLTEGWSPVWSPDGGKIAYELGTELCIVNSDGNGKIVVLSEKGGYIKTHCWSPDGKKILFIWSDSKNKENEGVWIVNADGSNLTKLVGGEAIAAAFSADGNNIAYIATEGKYDCLWVMRSDGSDKRKLIEYETYYPSHTGLQWSPSEKKILYGTYDVGIYVVQDDGTNRVRIVSHGGYRPAWSPDGRKIAYVTGDDMYIVNSDGTGRIKIAEGMDIWDFSWSPDGKRIVLGRDDEIYTVNADGSGLTRLAYGRYPQWSPVGLVKPAPKPTITPTPTLAQTEDPFNYNGEYTLDENKLRPEEKKALPYVMKYAKEYKVSPCLIMAVIRQESDFFDYSQDPDKDLDKFDIGYMQVSHIAAIDTYKKYTGDEYKGTEEQWQKDGLDPDINIKYGTRYLRIQHERIKDGHYKDVYNDILKSTLSAYKAGHPTKDNSKYVDEVINGRDLIDGQRRGYEFFLTIRVPVGGVPAPEKGVPGFEALFAIAGLLAVAYLLRKKK